MTAVTDPTFNIAGFQISEAFSPGFLQSGSPLANDINSLSSVRSFSDLASLAARTYNDAVQAGINVRYAPFNVFTGNSGISVVLTEGNNPIGAVGVSGVSSDASQILRIALRIHL